MSFCVAIMTVITALWSLCSCAVIPPENKSVNDYRAEQLTITGYGTISGEEENRIGYYKGEITGDTARRLYEIVCEQYSQEELKGGNYLPGMPYITITTPDGKEYTCSYTWDREEYCVDDLGMTGGSLAGTCFVISGQRSEKYKPVDDATIKEFERLIREYLTENCEPYKESLLNKSEKTDNIVFVSRCTNYAWGKVDNGYFIDVWGNMYRFDFSDRELENDGEFFDALWEIYCDTDPVKLAVCDSDRLLDILIEEIPKIDRNAPIRKKCTGARDMGQYTLYAVDTDGELIMLRSEGDWDRWLDDPAAESLCRFYDTL